MTRRPEAGRRRACRPLGRPARREPSAGLEPAADLYRYRSAA